MTHEERLNRYIEVCKRAWEDMLANDTWHWLEESPKPENLIESEDNPKKP